MYADGESRQKNKLSNLAAMYTWTIYVLPICLHDIFCEMESNPCGKKTGTKISQDNAQNV